MQLDSVAKVRPGQAPWGSVVGTNCPDFCNSSPRCCLSEHSICYSAPAPPSEATWMSPETLRLLPFTSIKKAGVLSPFIFKVSERTVV